MNIEQKLQKALGLLWFFLPSEEPDPHSRNKATQERNRRWTAACNLYHSEYSSQAATQQRAEEFECPYCSPPEVCTHPFIYGPKKSRLTNDWLQKKIAELDDSECEAGASLHENAAIKESFAQPPAGGWMSEDVIESLVIDLRSLAAWNVKNGNVSPSFVSDARELIRSAMPANDGWRGIESAPRDGTRFLVPHGDGSRQCWFDGEIKDFTLGNMNYEWQYIAASEFINIEFWHPMPKAPTTAMTQDGEAK